MTLNKQSEIYNDNRNLLDIYDMVYTWINMPDTDDIDKSEKSLKKLKDIISQYITHYNITKVTYVYHIGNFEEGNIDMFFNDLLKEWENNNLTRNKSIVSKYKSEMYNVNAYNDHCEHQTGFAYDNIPGLKIIESRYGILFDTEWDSLFFICK